MLCSTVIPAARCFTTVATTARPKTARREGRTNHANTHKTHQTRSSQTHKRQLPAIPHLLPPPARSRPIRKLHRSPSLQARRRREGVGEGVNYLRRTAPSLSNHERSREPTRFLLPNASQTVHLLLYNKGKGSANGHARSASPNSLRSWDPARTILKYVHHICPRNRSSTVESASTRLGMCTTQVIDKSSTARGMRVSITKQQSVHARRQSSIIIKRL